MSTTRETAPLALPQPAAPGDGGVSRDEWDMLFRAVVARLRLVLLAPPLAGSLQCSADDCLLALERLHVMLAAERGRAAGDRIDGPQFDARPADALTPPGCPSCAPCVAGSAPVKTGPPDPGARPRLEIAGGAADGDAAASRSHADAASSRSAQQQTGPARFERRRDG